MKHYIAVRWGNHESPDGLDGGGHTFPGVEPQVLIGRGLLTVTRFITLAMRYEVETTPTRMFGRKRHMMPNHALNLDVTLQ